MDARGLTAKWIQYLKNSQIVNMKSDPVTGRLIYRKPVYSATVAKFLTRELTLNEVTIHGLVESVVPTASATSVETLEGGGFFDLPGDEITEQEVEAIFAKALKRDQEDKWVPAMRTVAKSMTPAQRPAFISLVGAMRAGLVPLRPLQINGTIHALVHGASEPPESKGFLASWLSKLRKEPAGPNTEEIEHRWLEAGAPIDEKSFLHFLSHQGFDRDLASTALGKSTLDPSIETYASDKAFGLLADLAERVKDADADKLEDQFDFIRSIRDDEDEKEDDE